MAPKRTPDAVVEVCVEGVRLVTHALGDLVPFREAPEAFDGVLGGVLDKARPAP